MKIGIIASIWISVPPKEFGFGAQEFLEYWIAKLLTEKGHDVTLFASGDSNTNGRLLSINPVGVSEIETSDQKIKDIFELLNISQAYKHAEEFDVIHNHLLPYGLLFADLFQTPTIHTLHHAIHKQKAEMYLYEKYRDQNFISISNSQRNIVPNLNYINTVYNGTDTNFYSFKDYPNDDYLLYVGRMKKYKGIHEVIHVAEKLSKHLKIVSPLPNPSQPDYQEVIEYWENEIKPHINKNIEHIGLTGGKEKVQLYQNAKALIFPVERDEPFGMTIIEAMSCGTPVIAYANGASPEIIIDGKTGFLVNQLSKENYAIKKSGLDGLCNAVERIYEMEKNDYKAMRKNSRLHVAEKFNIQEMVNQYEKAYKKIL